MTAGSSSARRTARDELAEDTAHGELYLTQLRRAQLELSVLGLLAFGGVVGSLPLLFALLPALAHVAVVGVPLAAWMVAAPAFPIFVMIAVVYERRANALDQSFRDLIREE